MFVFWIKQMLCSALNILTHLICSLNIWLENSRDYNSNSLTSVMEFEGAEEICCRFLRIMSCGIYLVLTLKKPQSRASLL